MKNNLPSSSDRADFNVLGISRLYHSDLHIPITKLEKGRQFAGFLLVKMSFIEFAVFGHVRLKDGFMTLLWRRLI